MLGILAAPALGQTPAEPRFPLVFSQEQQLHPFGLDLRGPEDKRKPAFPHVCYAYGGEAHTVYLMSMSDAFLARHVARGFSRESVCLGLVSQVRFDPDTGRRLPTYVIKYPDKIEQLLATARTEGLNQKQARESLGEWGGITDELPLVVPDCFRNGTPYLDCSWKFGWQTGRPISAATREAAREWGRLHDAAMRQALAAGRVAAGKETMVEHYLPIAGYLSFGEFGDLKPSGIDAEQLGRIWERGSIRFTWSVVSPNLPRGHGYAINATGELGPSVSAEAVDAALDNRMVAPQITPAMVDRLLGWLAPPR